MNVTTVLGWAAVAFIVWWAVKDPAAVTHLVHNIGGFLSLAAARISSAARAQ